jgi:hypothetical protein
MPRTLTARPRRLNSAIAWLFMIDSSCFALGALPAYASAVGAPADATTYFVGSVFFTSASFLQLVQSQSPAMVPGPDEDAPRAARLCAFLPHDRNWLAAATQFPGTLEFNISTLFAINSALTASQADRVVWRPDFVGSTLFLVSSAFAILALERHARGYPRAIAWLNMLGSVAFMVSALGSYVVPTTGAILNFKWSELGTFIGALCFLAGAALMLPAWRAAGAQHAASPSARE